MGGVNQQSYRCFNPLNKTHTCLFIKGNHDELVLDWLGEGLKISMNLYGLSTEVEDEKVE